MAIQLIVGLGNPGPEYAQTRHNAGAWFAEMLAAQAQGHWQIENKFHAQICRISLRNHEVWLLIPNTYMNESGRSINVFANFYKIPAEAILVAHDELDFAPGVVRLKPEGGHGGHNGLRDIIEHLHTGNFYRLRIGIGRPGHRDRVHDFVLSRPSKPDFELIMDAITKATAVIPEAVAGDMQKAMQSLHTDNT